MTTTAKPLQTLPRQAAELVQPWWRYPMVWLVVGGPLAVVVAGVATVVIAYQNIDPVMDVSRPTSNASDKPAIQARNLAADHAMKPPAVDSRQAVESP